MRFRAMDRDDTPQRPRKRFDPLARPFEWYRLPLAIKLGVLQLWRKEQEAEPAQSGVRPKIAKRR